MQGVYLYERITWGGERLAGMSEYIFKASDIYEQKVVL